MSMLNSGLAYRLKNATLGAALVAFIGTATGAIARPVSAILNEFTSVSMFGPDKTGATDATADIQAALNAGGKQRVPAGTYLISSTLNITKPVELVGDGKGIVTFTQATNFTMFSVSGFSGGWKIADICITNSQASASVTSGDAIFASNALYGDIQNVRISNCYNGVHVQGSQAVRVRDVDVFFHKNAAILLDGNNNNDVYFARCFIDGELAGTPTGTYGIDMQNKCEAITFDSCEVVLCVNALQTGATSFTSGNRPAYCRFTNCFFDSSTNGAQLDQCVDFSFNACWFSNRPGSGCTVGSTNADGTSFVACTFANCGTHGCLVQAGALRTTFEACKFIGNGTGDSGLVFAANTTDFSVRNCVATNGWGYAGAQSHGITIVAGTSTRYVLTGNNVTGNSGAGISDGSTGTPERYVRDNIGFRTTNAGHATLASGNTTVTITHGLAITPAQDDIYVWLESGTGGISGWYISAWTSTTFTITVNTAPGANIQFGWRIESGMTA